MRKYSSTIPAMTLGAQLTAGSTSITLNTGAWPTVSSPDTLTLVIEPDTANEEIVYVTAHTSGSSSATIARGKESTADITHASGSVVKHMITGADLQEAHTHMNATSYSTNSNVALHGIGSGEGAVVGTDKTQILKNKTINISDNNSISGLTVSNVSGIAGTYAPLASPALTGSPTVNGVAIATTATAPASHTHGNLTNDGKIGTSSGNVIVTGAAGALTALAAGSAGQFLSYNGTWATPPTGTGGGGTVTQVTGTAPISVANTTTTPAITIASASTTTVGAVQLSSATNSTSTTLAATASAVKSAYDLAAAAIPNTTLTTKGDILTRSTSAIDRLPVGSNGQFLVADSTTTTGLKWADASSTSKPFYLRVLDSSNITSVATTIFATSNSLAANTIYKFKYLAFLYYDYLGATSQIVITHSFSNTPQEFVWIYSNLNDTLSGQHTVTTGTTVSNSLTTDGGKLIEVEGYFQTNASTGGTFTPQVHLNYTTGGTNSTIVIKKGSYIEYSQITSGGAWI